MTLRTSVSYMYSSNRGFLSRKDLSSLNKTFIDWSFGVGDKDSQIPVLVKSIPTVCIIKKIVV